MNRNATILLGAVSWSELQSSMGDASSVPAAVEQLVEASTTTDADKAYWRLDNVVVVQGRVFDAALPLVPVLLALLGGNLRSAVRSRVLDLLFEIRYGHVHEDQAPANIVLGEACKSAVQDGLWLYWACLLDDDRMVRKTAIDLIGELETNSDLRRLALQAARQDPDEQVNESAGP